MDETEELKSVIRSELAPLANSDLLGIVRQHLQGEVIFTAGHKKIGARRAVSC